MIRASIVRVLVRWCPRIIEQAGWVHIRPSAARPVDPASAALRASIARGHPIGAVLTPVPITGLWDKRPAAPAPDEDEPVDGSVMRGVLVWLVLALPLWAVLWVALSWVGA